MHAQPANHSAPDLVSIEVDGNAMQVPQGSMIIEATDKAGITVPRFCYHRKLSVAANCRMCLVDVEMGGRPSPKPLPACATPVAAGMKVLTRSDKALKAQRNTMEFLLINHPLDCPICDQGGECELQDVSLGYGRSVSRFTERKRSVADEDLGPLIATDMTRCIQCTRCVRFMDEIAGTCELGGMSRGDRLEIGTYIGKTLDSELSGNIIDICPVGALTNKVSRFKARAWELVARPAIAYHDALGSNQWLHIHRGEVLRTVPRDNESVNQCWLSDRDRYSHQGLYAADRVSAPLLKRNGQWIQSNWDDALQAAIEALKAVPGAELGLLAHAATSNEEGELLVRLARGLGSAHLDHRLRQLDFADAAVAQSFQMPVEAMQQARAVLLVGSDLRHEMPLLNHRLRQAQRHGAAIFAINPAAFTVNYELAGATVVAPARLLDALLSGAKAASADGVDVPAPLAEAVARASTDATAQAIFARLKDSEPALIVLGELAVTHPQASWLRAVAGFIATAAGTALNELPVGANAVGLARSGVLPGPEGLDARAMLAQPRKAYLLYGVEPPYDFADAATAMHSLLGAEHVVAFAAFANDALKQIAEVILPIALVPEMDATLVNVDGRVQTTVAGAGAPGESRAGWKVLRALGGQLQLPGFEFDDLAELRSTLSAQAVGNGQGLSAGVNASADDGLVRLASWPPYRSDAVVRRAAGLAAHPLNRAAAVRLNPRDAARLALAEGDTAMVDGSASLPVVLDAGVAAGSAWIEAAHADTATLPPYGAAMTVSKV